MPIPALTHSTSTVRESDAEAIVLALPPLDAAAAHLAEWPGLESVLRSLAFTGSVGSTVRAWAPEATALPIVVVGTGAEPSAHDIRDAVGAAVRTTGGFDALAVTVPGAGPDLVAAAAEGAVLGGYVFDRYKAQRPAARRAQRVTLHADGDLGEALAHATAVGEAVALVKDLVHTPAADLGPADVADRAIESLAELDVTVEVFDEQRLVEEGYGGIVGVGRGSERPPRLVRVDYAPADAARHIAIVGKGITFDTGGLSLKPAAGMVGMKYDMCGAASALAVVRAAATLRLPVRVSGWLCLAENMPSGSATRPGDILTMLDGTTVEVLNTDAEGRLVLADGLVAASRTRPDVLVDIATLTGAIMVALGTRHTGVMGADAAVAQYLAAAESAGEAAWRMPLPSHMEDELDSPIADMQNAKIGDPNGGALFAGLFLQRFVGRVSDADDAERIPWVHLDIAGSGLNKGAGYGPVDKGPTAAAVRSLIALVESAA